MRHGATIAALIPVLALVAALPPSIRALGSGPEPGAAAASPATGQTAAGSGPQELGPGMPYAVSRGCLTDLFSDACGAGVPELGWLDVVKLCSGGAAEGDPACDAVRPALPDCEAQSAACFPSVPRDQVIAGIGNLCGADPAAPGCDALQRGGDTCLDSPACTTNVTSEACAGGGGGICPSLENTLGNFGSGAPTVDRSTPARAGMAPPLAPLFKQIDNTGSSNPGDRPLRAVVFDGSWQGPGSVTAVEAPATWESGAGGTQSFPEFEAFNHMLFFKHLDASLVFPGGNAVAPQTLVGGQDAQTGTRLYAVTPEGWLAESLPATGDAAGDAAVPPSALFRDMELSATSGAPNELGGAGQIDLPVFISDPGVSAATGGGVIPTLFDPVADPEPFISVPGGRDATVQLMIVVRINLTVPARQPPAAPEAPSLWSAIRRTFSFRALSASASPGNAVWRPSAPALRGVPLRVSNGAALRPVRSGAPVGRPAPLSGAGAVAQDSPLQLFLTNVGSSTGEAFTAHVVNNGDEPIDVDVKGLVVEPLGEQAQRRVQQQLQQAMPQNPISAQLTGYCLEFLQLPPLADQMFQLAPRGQQQQFAPVRDVLAAAEQLNQMGLLPPDSDPTAYYHSITQWAVWTQQEGFDQGSFTDAFVAHTRKQVEASGNQWSSQFDEVLRGAAPARWQNITRILDTADGR